jgi:hypothetical protein
MLSNASTAYDRFIEVNFAVSNFEIEFTVGVCADPRLIVHCGALSAKVRQRYKIAFPTTQAIWPVIRFQLLTFPQHRRLFRERYAPLHENMPQYSLILFRSFIETTRDDANWYWKCIGNFTVFGVTLDILL